MHKGIGRAQQLRGHKRRQKVLNRNLNRNPSDHKKVEGTYAKFINKLLGIDNDEEQNA